MSLTDPGSNDQKIAVSGQSVDNKVRLELVGDYRFKVDFPGAEQTTLIMDEPPPLGEMKGPNAARVLAASIANCLSASLVFCLRKSRIPVKSMKAEAIPLVMRNNEGYLRVTRVDIALYAEIEDNAEHTRVKRCLDIFENYCVVTGAVRNGLTVDVKVNTSKLTTV